ncbi:hypothetical protein U879_20465 [Defluviimonas sp. 20V17]|uniref:Porin n=1 Tax=Allgaiera indica TaxID=765699 RepID=A0AAN4UNA3_9RHOB|nr:porin [Allgaiera indica]KDB01785.1 hypothetical protein U879_20465 [Defluviimonas sp. 20V17]GHD98861.1 hypothetical protein GCM10008024_04070 [Allgaiera indica]SDW04580.1 porin [Allgaiera indica]
MKKILLATAAVALTAGAASADVTFSGYARAGISYSKPKNGTATTALTDRFRLYLKVDKKTDSGLELGVKTRFQSDSNRANISGTGTGVLQNGASQIWIQQNGVKVEFDNVDGPIEDMPGVYAPTTGLTGLSYGGMVTNYYDAGGTYHSFDWMGNYQGYGANGTYGNASGVQVNYTMGALHAELARGGLATGAGNTSTQAMISYNFGQFTGALGYSTGSYNGSQSRRVVGTVSGKIGPVNLTLGAASNAPVTNGTKGTNVTKYALNAAYTMGAVTMNAYYAHQDKNAPSNAYGVGAKYDLGGAALQGGVAKDPSGATKADFGVIFTF